jgi:hypothetical protein
MTVRPWLPREHDVPLLPPAGPRPVPFASSRARLATGAVALFYAVSCFILWQTYGLFSLRAVIPFFASWVFAIVVASRVEAPAPPSRRATHVTLYAWCTAMPLVWLVDRVLLYPEPGVAYVVFRVTGACVSALCVASAVADARKHERHVALLLYAAAYFVFVARVLVLRVSPAPHIDVFTTATAAADHLLAGRNPYSQRYVDIYAGAYDYTPTMPYWPAILLWETVWRKLAGDIRAGCIVAEAMTSGILLVTLRALDVPRVTGALVVLVWLVHPTANLIVEQSWIDSLLVVSFAALAWAMITRRVWTVGIALGLAVAFKQYGILGATVSLAFLWLTRGGKVAIRAAGVAAAVSAATFVPFVVWDAPGLYRMTVEVPSHLHLRRDSLSALVLFADFLPDPWPSRITPCVAVASTGIAVTWLMARRRHRDGRELGLSDWALALVFVYGTFFFFAKQAFCNYYAFQSFFALFYVATALGTPWIHERRASRQGEGRGEDNLAGGRHESCIAFAPRLSSSEAFQ